LKPDPATPADGSAAEVDAPAAASAAARRSYGRLVAWLAWQWRDIAAAEDALSEALLKALLRWPVDGIPKSPEAWLLAVARRELLLSARRQRRDEDPLVTILHPGELSEAPAAPIIPDDRLRLMFVCTHPAIDPAMHSALMLQTVLGITAERIASAFLVSPQAMARRLVRAKAKIRDGGIRFDEPLADELAERVQAVLEAVYAAYVLDTRTAAAIMQSAPAAADDPALPDDLADEALFLARLVSDCLPEEPEALGLRALLAFCEARRPARLDEHGAFVPLDRQDPRHWDAALLEEARQALKRAAALRRPGPLQIEAAIQAAHCDRQHTGVVPWIAIAQLYQRLIERAPTIGARIGQAAALAHASPDAQGADLGLRVLDDIEPSAIASHQPWWAARAHLLAQAGRAEEAAAAYRRAMALSTDPALRAFLAGRLAGLGGG
jgi:RNA polymerase sigma-70 factor (ECF subfamily)